MKILGSLLVCFIVSIFGFTAVLFSYSRTGESKLIETYPLENYMFQKYDSQGFEGYTLVLAIMQPVPNTRYLVDDTIDMGNAFIRLAKSGKNSWTSYFSYGMEETEEEYKFKSKVNLHVDATNEFTLAKVFTINETDAQNVEKYMWDEYKTVKTYNLANSNFITFLLNVAKKANIPDSALGIVPRKWTLPEFVDVEPEIKSEIESMLEIKDFFGYSAADAGEDMKATGGVVFYKDMPE
jgi:hypothetical protein